MVRHMSDEEDDDSWRDLVCEAHQAQYELLFEKVDATGWASINESEFVDDLDCPDCTALEAKLFGVSVEELEYMRIITMLQIAGIHEIYEA